MTETIETDKAEEQALIQIRNIFTSTIEENKHFPCLFTRRYIKSTKKYQYYLYSSDEQFLFAAAALENDFLFTISLNSNTFSNLNWSAGSLRGTPNNQFTGILIANGIKNKQFQNSIRIDINASQKSVQVKIAPPGQINFIFIDGDSNEFKPLTFTQIKDPNHQQYLDFLHFALEYNGKLCFNLYQIHDDEFRIQCGFPFSLFQAFCICLSSVFILA